MAVIFLEKGVLSNNTKYNLNTVWENRVIFLVMIKLCITVSEYFNETEILLELKPTVGRCACGSGSVWNVGGNKFGNK